MTIFFGSKKNYIFKFYMGNNFQILIPQISYFCIFFFPGNSNRLVEDLLNLYFLFSLRKTENKFNFIQISILIQVVMAVA